MKTDNLAMLKHTREQAGKELQAIIEHCIAGRGIHSYNVSRTEVVGVGAWRIVLRRSKLETEILISDTETAEAHDAAFLIKDRIWFAVEQIEARSASA
jgi:hypothetical protein